MQFRRITTAALSFALLGASMLPASAYTEGASQAEPTGFLSQNCYRSNSTGIYETKRDAYINHMNDTLVHAGACTKCEGKSVAPPNACFEPGDDPAFDVGSSGDASTGYGNYGTNNSSPQPETTPWAY